MNASEGEIDYSTGKNELTHVTVHGHSKKLKAKQCRPRIRRSVHRNCVRSGQAPALLVGGAKVKVGGLERLDPCNDRRALVWVRPVSEILDPCTALQSTRPVNVVTVCHAPK